MQCVLWWSESGLIWYCRTWQVFGWTLGVTYACRVPYRPSIDRICPRKGGKKGELTSIFDDLIITSSSRWVPPLSIKTQRHFQNIHLAICKILKLNPKAVPMNSVSFFQVDGSLNNGHIQLYLRLTLEKCHVEGLRLLWCEHFKVCFMCFCYLTGRSECYSSFLCKKRKQSASLKLHSLFSTKGGLSEPQQLRGGAAACIVIHVNCTKRGFRIYILMSP